MSPPLARRQTATQGKKVWPQLATPATTSDILAITLPGDAQERRLATQELLLATARGTGCSVAV
ncbi:hypothetical protein A2U01_0109620 [Trifolium medium]|uniref:Uncharacterized protein n=1 Tax=Trifolium medium TaxID=97028 RepID=A0A392VLJ5_9FABA|nr:hypothetical protein [Trifolium medium]